jgi:PiT family inorganic phosphate transporter
VIASRAMTPAQAVIIVGVFEFLGPLLGGTAVANTIGKFVALDGVAPILSLSILLCGLIGAIVWNLGTWYFGIPSSSSHALVGGLAGAVVVAVGGDHVVWGFAELADGHLTGIVKVLAALVLSPLIGFWVGYLVHRLLTALLVAANPAANSRLRGLQYLTAAGLAFSHGANDAQKSMGILTLVLLLGGFIPTFEVPFWVMLACATAITLGIMSGGWRIVRTLGFAIYRVRPIHALGSQLTSAGVIMAASIGGAPVSTTHVVATSIMGIGASERPRAVRWAKAKDIAMTWLITIPGAAIVAIQAYALVHLFIGGTP